MMEKLVMSTGEKTVYSEYLLRVECGDCAQGLEEAGISAKNSQETLQRVRLVYYSWGMVWRAVYTQPCREAVAVRFLRRWDVEVFYPFVREVVRRRRAGRRDFALVEVERPYFSRYFFAELPDRMLSSLDTVPGVGGVVGFGGVPVSVPEQMIAVLRAMASTDGCIEFVNRTLRSAGFKGRAGDKFVFTGENSVLNGLLGELVSVEKLDSQGQVTAFLSLFGSRRRVEIPAWMVGEIVEARQDFEVSQVECKVSKRLSGPYPR